MQKTDFVKSVAERAGVSQKEAKLVVDAALDIITETLKAGEKVTLTGFGSFTPRRRNARTGRNPRTGAALEIPAHTTVLFRPGKQLKAWMAGNG